MSGNDAHDLRERLRQRELEFPTKRGEQLKFLRDSRLTTDGIPKHDADGGEYDPLTGSAATYAKLLLRTLDDHIGSGKTWKMTIPQLADEMECSEATVERRVKDLCERRLLIVEAVDIEAQKYEFQIVFSNLQDWIPEGCVRSKTKRRGRRRKPLSLAAEAQPEAGNFEQRVGNSELTVPNFEQRVGNSELTVPNCQLTDLGTSCKRRKAPKKAPTPLTPRRGEGLASRPAAFGRKSFRYLSDSTRQSFARPGGSGASFAGTRNANPSARPPPESRWPTLNGPAAKRRSKPSTKPSRTTGKVCSPTPTKETPMIASNEKPNVPKANGNAPSGKPNPVKAIGEALKPLQELCRDPKSASALRMFAELLVDLPPADIDTAVKRYLGEADEAWFPSPGKLRKLAMEAADGEFPEWQHAWHRIMEARGIWDRSDREKAIAAREHVGEWLMAFVNNMGGFIAMETADAETLSVFQSHFRQSFTNERERAIRNRALPESLRPGPAKLKATRNPAKLISGPNAAGRAGEPQAIGEVSSQLISRDIHAERVER